MSPAVKESILNLLQAYDLSQLEQPEKLMAYCDELSYSVVNLRKSINKYKEYKNSKKK